MTAAAAPGMERVRKEFEDKSVEFILVYVREAHPGERFTAHQSMEQKRQDARALAELEGIQSKLAIDDLDGTIHRQYGLQPNMLYVVDKQGRVAFRALWAEEVSLRRALTRVVDAERNGARFAPKENRRIFVPMMHGMSETPRVLERAGNRAVRDFGEAMGGGALLLGRMTAWFRPALRAAPERRAVVAGLALSIPALIFLSRGKR